MTKISDLSLVSSPTSGDSFPILQAGANKRITFTTLFGSLPGPINMSTSGTAAAPVFSFNTDPDTGMYRASTNLLGLAAGGTLIMSLSTAGVSINAPVTIGGGNGYLRIDDGITAPTTSAGTAALYVDTADGDLKVKFGDGTVKTIVVDT